MTQFEDFPQFFIRVAFKRIKVETKISTEYYWILREQENTNKTTLLQVLLKTAMTEIKAKSETKTCIICAFSMARNQKVMQ